MKVTVNSSDMKQATGAVSALIPEPQVYLYTDTSTNTLVMEAGQSGIFLKQRLPAQIEEEGELVINSTYLGNLKLGDTLHLSTESASTLNFKSGNLKGKLETHQASQSIKDQRPLEDISTPLHITKDLLVKAISKTNFSTGLVQTQEGLRVKIDSHMSLSTTDQYRIALYREEMPPVNNPSIDFVIKPATMSLAVSKIKESEVWLGLKKGTIKIASPTFEFYQPAIQTEPTDVEGWLTDLDEDELKGVFKTTVTAMLNAVQEVTSIAGSGSVNNEIKLKCRIGGNKLVINVDTVHGDAENTLELQECDIENCEVTLHNKYTTEMLSLIKDGEVEVSLYDSFLVVRALEGRCTNVIPTMSD